MPAVDTGSFMIVVDDPQRIRTFLESFVGLASPNVTPNGNIATYKLVDGSQTKELSLAQASQFASGLKHSIEIRVDNFDTVFQNLQAAFSPPELANMGITFGLDTSMNVIQIVLDLGFSRLRVTRME